MAWLVAVDGDLAGRRFPLDAPCLVGRGPYNHVVLDDTRISRQHAKISPEPGGHVVYDLNSANGTFVNEVQVKKQKLKPNDVLRFGPFTFRFDAPRAETTDKHLLPSGKKFVEVLTSIGPAEPEADIVDSLDAASATNPDMPGLLQLEDADRKLRTLYSFLQSISSTLDVNDLLERVMANLFDVFPAADTVVVYLVNPATGALEPRRSRRRSPDAPPRSITFPGPLHEEVMGKGRAILSAPTTSSTRRQRGGLWMHAPILYRNVSHGVLHVRGAEEAGTPFSQDDLDLLTGLAAQAGLALQNARFFAESLRQQRLEQDLLLAEQIQKSFLPRQLPSVEGIEFVTEYKPAYSVGGDFYDIFWVNYDRIGLFIGDVSGKGVSAALLMARISSDLRLAASAEPDPARVLALVNHIVLDRRQSDSFVTAIYATLDVKTFELTLANAGHPPPLIRRGSGEVERVDEGTGTAIGIFEETEYEQTRRVLQPGDTMLLCTDGLVEATSAGGEQFGLERLEESMRRGDSSPALLVQRLLGDVRAHVGEASQYDDLTLLVCGASGLISPERRKRRDEPTESIRALD
jgi:serine phosphatase RsbU (regulator of sigma subunit)